MINYLKNKNIFTSNCDYLVNPVNTVGVMGKGLAKQFKISYPHNFNVYKNKCNNGFSVGEVLIVLEKNKHIVNFPTKTNWRLKSNVDYIISSLNALTKYHNENKINSIAFPKVGCGLGGLNWEEVKPLIENWKKENNISLVEVYV